MIFHVDFGEGYSAGHLLSSVLGHWGAVINSTVILLVFPSSLLLGHLYASGILTGIQLRHMLLSRTIRLLTSISMLLTRIESLLGDALLTGVVFGSIGW